MLGKKFRVELNSAYIDCFPPVKRKPNVGCTRMYLVPTCYRIINAAGALHDYLKKCHQAGTFAVKYVSEKNSTLVIVRLELAKSAIRPISLQVFRLRPNLCSES